MTITPFDPTGKLYFGLGNPTKEYENTYHSIGAHALLFLSNTHRNGFSSPSRKHFSYMDAGTHVYTLGETYMNESGIAVQEALRYFDKNLHQLIVLHDDSDMNIGSFKVVYNQGSAGHHGIDSIIQELGSSEFYRIKIGIRKPKESIRKKAEEFVLKKISTADRKIFQEVFEKIKKIWK